MAREVYGWLGVKERCSQWYREGGHEQGAADWKALADFADYILFKKPLLDADSFYQEPWPDVPRGYSWETPRLKFR